MKIRIALAVALCLGLAGSLAGQQPGASRPNVVTGRSKVATKYGIVAASQPLAARAGVQILERGGNAVDAAIATNAVMALVEPHNNGIGGDVFVIYYEAKSGKLYGLNAGGWAPSGLTPAFLRSKGLTRMPNSGIYSVTVPGAVKGWEMLRARFGTAAVRFAGAGHLLRRRRLPGHGCDRRRVERRDQEARSRSERQRRHF